MDINKEMSIVAEIADNELNESLLEDGDDYYIINDEMKQLKIVVGCLCFCIAGLIAVLYLFLK